VCYTLVRGREGGGVLYSNERQGGRGCGTVVRRKEGILGIWRETERAPPSIV
jgi:hypothetical protein